MCFIAESSKGRVSRTVAATTCACAALMSVLVLGACGGEEASTPTAEGPPPEVVSAHSAPFAKYSDKGPGELRLAEFGTEGSKSDRLRAQATIDAFLAANGNGEWERACGYASEILLAQIDELIHKAKQSPPPSCGEVLRALASSGGMDSPPLSAPRGVASLRIKEGPGGGFALFHGSDGEDHWMPMRREEGGWTVLSAAPQRFE